MKIQQRKFSAQSNWVTLKTVDLEPAGCQLVMAFGSVNMMAQASVYNDIREMYPAAEILMSSTSGEIYDQEVNTETVSLTAIQFTKSSVKTTSVLVNEMTDSRQAGQVLGAAFDSFELKNVLVLSDGQLVNGSDLVCGLKEALPPGTVITGGLAGDEFRFEKTMVGLNEVPVTGKIIAVGFYGSNLSVGFGSAGGWTSFGPERIITKSSANILYELGGKPALEIYKMYLGDYARELPGSALFYPLSIRMPDSTELIVRTILGIDEKNKSLRFAGNMPAGSYARMMLANLDALIEGAAHAAALSISGNVPRPELAILISCVGRKLVLNQRTDEEIEVIRNIYGPDTAITGFYSYGEIAPSSLVENCELHNETMTITTFSEL